MQKHLLRAEHALFRQVLQYLGKLLGVKPAMIF